MERRDMIRILGTLTGSAGLAMAGCFKVLMDREKRRWNVPEPKELEGPSGPKPTEIESPVSPERRIKRTDWVYEIIDKHDSLRRDFYRAVIKVESNDNPDAVGRAGERGLMQIMPGTWQDVAGVNFDRAFDPNSNVRVGIRYYMWLAEKIEEGLGEERWKNLPREERFRMAAAAYNGGIGRMRRNGFDIRKMPNSTQRYVEKVIRKFEELRE